MAAETRVTPRRKPVRRTKERFSLWVEPETYAALKEVARQRKAPMTGLAEDFIREGLGMVAAARLDGPALPAVRQVVEEVADRHTERLAKLIVKAFLEAGMGRRLTYALIDKQAGPERAPQVLAGARTSTLEDLRKRVGEF